MSTIPASVKCDGCGKNRIEDTNHWFSIRAEEYFHIIHRTNEQNQYRHACGLECATKLFQKWFAEGKL